MLTRGVTPHLRLVRARVVVKSAVAGRCAATIEVELSGAGETVVVEEYARCRPLGRVALRDGGATLAVGVVTKVLE